MQLGEVFRIMPASDSKSLPSIGFLTVRDFEQIGLIGGYLVLNPVGRPLEFHCTAPVRANRAQEILYGPTLHPFLYGEQIGQTLVAKGKNRPLFICTDVEHVLALRTLIQTPVVLLDRSASGESPGSTQLRVDGQHSITPPEAGWKRFELGGYAVAVSTQFENDSRGILDSWRPHDGSLDLCEPFFRLSEALEETQGGANR